MGASPKTNPKILLYTTLNLDFPRKINKIKKKLKKD